MSRHRRPPRRLKMLETSPSPVMPASVSTSTTPDSERTIVPSAERKPSPRMSRRGAEIGIASMAVIFIK